MNKKKKAHFEAFGYEPLRMKPAHFAIGFFSSVTREAYTNEVLNKVAVTKTSKGLLDEYTSDSVFRRLHEEQRIDSSISQSQVELLREQVRSVVNNDEAMYAAFPPYNPKGSDYTFFSRRMLTRGDATDGYAGLFIAQVLNQTREGKTVLSFAEKLASPEDGPLDHLVSPLVVDEEAEESDLDARYKNSFGVLDVRRLQQVANSMQHQTGALTQLCENLDGFRQYRQVRYFIIGLMVWLTSYILRRSSVDTLEPLLLFDATGDRDGRIRSESKTCYARTRELVRRSYFELADSASFSEDPIESGTFARKKDREEHDFRFLEDHFRTLVLRMGYVQPRASNVRQKHYEFRPDTLRVLMLSILQHDATKAITYEEVCKELYKTWNVIVGGRVQDVELVRQRGYFGIDEADLTTNAISFAERLVELNLAAQPSDGLILCSRDLGQIL